MSNIEYEEVNTIFVNGRAIQIGDTLQCSCQYKVSFLYPVWDSNTGKHLIQHNNNSFSCNLIKDANCPVHHITHWYEK